jgi:hypothetical protein
MRHIPEKDKTQEVNAKCRHLKKFICKGTLRQVYIRDNRQFSCIHSVMLVFSTQLCDLYFPLLPSPILSGSTLPPPHPCVNKYTAYRYSIQCVRWGRYGVLLETIFSRVLIYTLYLTRFRTYKIVRLPQTKIWEKRGPKTDKHLLQSPIIGKFVWMTIFFIAFYESFFLRIYLSVYLFVLYSALLHLPPLRFHCADGCWDRT